MSRRQNNLFTYFKWMLVLGAALMLQGAWD